MRGEGGEEKCKNEKKNPRKKYTWYQLHIPCQVVHLYYQVAGTRYIIPGTKFTGYTRYYLSIPGSWYIHAVYIIQ